MHDDKDLRWKAREALQTGRFPAIPPERVWAGPGTGAACAICGLVTLRDEVELELEYPPARRSAQNVYLVHRQCFSVLDRERPTQEEAGGI